MSLTAKQLLVDDTTFGFIDKATESTQIFQPLLISNEDENTMLRTVRSELLKSESFVISVAFITTGALGLLKQALLDFRGPGRIVTSTYLNFNSPEVFQELINLEGVEVYVYDGLAGFHAKGYIFRQAASTTAIVGSSNLTSTALLQNMEWNLRFSALPDGDITEQLHDAVERQIAASSRLTSEWIDAYEQVYVRNPQTIIADQPGPLDPATVSPNRQIYPNSMQTEALEALEAVRESGETRAIVISATGTGKTILAALDVRAVQPSRVLFIVHREQIVDRAITEFQAVLQTPDDSFGKFVGTKRELDRKFVFATVQSLSKPEALNSIDPEHFDYILIDEVHRAGAASYRRVIEWFKPKFLLGLTATPERTDDFNVFELFDHNVPYEIRLHAALEAGMLSPFHYYGVTDYIDETGISIDETTNLSKLVTPERVAHLVKALQDYGHAGPTRGLVFCSRREEALEISRLMNSHTVHGKTLRTIVLSGLDSVETRNREVERLEAGEIDYILTVDIFNEGIDIPSINQVVMLRQTKSSIVFTQQLGRGLRKAVGKDHLRVIDFIGNYANNYLIPIALLGDSSLNKETIRRKLIRVNEAGALSGLSSINFDLLTRDRVLRALATSSLDSMANIKSAFLDLEQRLGRAPRLLDFARFENADPVAVATKRGNYWRLLNSFKRVSLVPDPDESAFLDFLSMELLNGKRPHELLMLRSLIENGSIELENFADDLQKQGCKSDEATLDSVIRVLTLDFFTAAERQKYGGHSLIESSAGVVALSSRVLTLLRGSQELSKHVIDLIETGLFLARHRYSWSGTMQVGQMYSRKDACRLLNWKKNEYSTIYGYKVDYQSASCPIFVTYHKADDVSEGTQYEDQFLDAGTLKWFTRSKRTLESKEVQAIVGGQVPLHLFVKKDDTDGADFYYLGTAHSKNAAQTTMAGPGGKPLNVVTTNLGLASPLEESLYQYLSGSND